MTTTETGTKYKRAPAPFPRIRAPDPIGEISSGQRQPRLEKELRRPGSVCLFLVCSPRSFWAKSGPTVMDKPRDDRWVCASRLISSPPPPPAPLPVVPVPPAPASPALHRPPGLSSQRIFESDGMVCLRSPTSRRLFQLLFPSAASTVFFHL